MPQSQHYIPESLRWFIINSLLQNTRPKEIIANVKRRFHRLISYRTINRLWIKYQRTGSIVDLERAGRPKALSERDQRALVQSFIKEPGLSVKWVAMNILFNQKPISRRAIRRTLRSRGLIPKTSSTGKEIVQKNRVLRLKWALNFVNWELQEWRSIVFTDESTIFPKRMKSRVIWSQRGSPPSTDEEPNMKRLGIQVWAFITYRGERGIYRFRGTMKQDKYLRMLQQHLREAIPIEDDPNNELIFMQDGASYHKANIVMKWLRNEVNILPWPAQSPI